MTTDTDDDDALVEPVARWIRDFMPDHIDTVERPLKLLPCMYSMTPDEDFVIDFLGGGFGKDVVVGAGFSGHGFKVAPAVGRILAEMAMDGEAGIAVEGLWTTRRETSGIIEIVNADEHRVLLEILPPTVFRMISYKLSFHESCVKVCSL
jgi:glycine/D-amino acid oxidase-like deaminating enzyme